MLQKLITSSIVILLISLCSAGAFAAATGENYDALVQQGCNSLLAPEKNTGAATDPTLLKDVSAEQFLHFCKWRGEHFLKAPPADEFVGQKYTVSLIQAVCMGAVSPDLYKEQQSWVRTRIGCVKTMLEGSKTPALNTLAQHIVAPAGGRSPASNIGQDREKLHQYERELNSVLYNSAAH